MRILHFIRGLTAAQRGKTPEGRLHRSIFIARVLIKDSLRFDLFKQASAMAYVTLLSLVPSLTVVFVLISLFTPFLSKDSNLISGLRNFIIENLTSNAGGQAAAYLDKLLASINLTKIGIAGFMGFLVSLVFLLRNIEIVFNRIWMVERQRPIFTRFVYFWTFLTLGFFIVSMVVGLASGFNVEHYFKFADGIKDTADSIGIWTLFTEAATAFVFFFFLYKIIPNCFVSYRAGTVGALSAAVMFQAASKTFAFYVKTAAGYKTVYGTLAVLPIFLIWLYVCWIVVLLGGVIAWRADQDWPEEGKADADSPATNRFKKMRVRSIVPLFVLLEIYRHFAKENRQPTRGEAIAKRFNFPKEWVQESLNYLADNEFILVAAETTESKVESFLQHRFFPTYPLEHLRLDRIASTILEPINDWLQDAHFENEAKYVDVLRMILNSNSVALRETSLKQCFEKIGILAP